MVGHVCSPSLNPRNKGRCDCGKKIPAREPFSAPEKRFRPRDLESEREWLRQAARGLCDPDEAMVQAEIRSTRLAGQYVSDPMMVRTDMDRGREGQEEALDGINHVRWWLEDNVGHPLAQKRLRALQYFLLAFNELAEDE